VKIRFKNYITTSGNQLRIPTIVELITPTIFWSTVNVHYKRILLTRFETIRFMKPSINFIVVCTYESMKLCFGEFDILNSFCVFMGNLNKFTIVVHVNLSWIIKEMNQIYWALTLTIRA